MLNITTANARVLIARAWFMTFTPRRFRRWGWNLVSEDLMAPGSGERRLELPFRAELWRGIPIVSMRWPHNEDDLHCYFQSRQAARFRGRRCPLRRGAVSNQRSAAARFFRATAGL